MSLSRALSASFVLLLLATAAAVQPRPDDAPEAGPEVQSAADNPARAGPQPGRRFIVSIETANTNRRQRAVARGNVKTQVAQQGGVVVEESINPDNPFIAFEATSSDQAASIGAAVRGTKGVRFIEEDLPRYPMGRPIGVDELVATAKRSLLQTPIQPYGISKVQAPSFQTRSTRSPIDTTKKFPICIIDSGIDITHPAFASGVTVVQGDPAGFNTDSCGHGTHVAGTIAARTTIDGVLNSPNVELMIVKVFNGANCAWTYSSSLTVAMQKCQQWGARIVSMSLGAGGQSSAERTQVNNMYQQTNGMLLFAAASNDGTSATSYPAGYVNVISVAALDSNNARASFSNYNSDVELAAPGVGVLSTYPVALSHNIVTLAASGGISLDTTGTQLSLLDGSPSIAFSGAPVNCTINSCPNPGTAGKVCVIPRGTTSFCDKVTMCAAAGGVAAIIYNNAAGSFLGTLGTSCPGGTGITSLALPLALAPQFQGAATITGTIGALYPYETMDGTSMATPHASAVAALVWSMKPTCKNTIIRCALQRGALDLGTTGRDVNTGFGLVRAQAAVNYLGSTCTCTFPSSTG